MAKPFVDGVGDDIREAYEDVRLDDSETNWWEQHAGFAVSILASIICSQKPQTVKAESQYVEYPRCWDTRLIFVPLSIACL